MATLSKGESLSMTH